MLIILLIGIAAFGMAWMPAVSKRTGISYSIFYVLAGVLLYRFFPGSIPSPIPEKSDFLLHFTEITVIISLMGTGIKIDRPFSIRNWMSPLKLISTAMLLCIIAAFLMALGIFGFDPASALLLGAVLAPTDPVLASDVQVGPPNQKGKSETRFALTSEAGLNDGMAFPFTLLAVTLAVEPWNKDTLISWLAYDFLYKILAGIVIGYLLGRATGYLVFRISRKYSFLKTRDGFLASSLTLMVYGITELAHGYGFIAVFISAITLQHFEKEDGYHDDLHSFTDQTERLLVGILLILFGGSLVSGILAPLTWKMAAFSLVFLLLIRPFAAYASLFTGRFHFKEKLAISFFGIRGIGSIFYLAFAFKYHVHL